MPNFRVLWRAIKTTVFLFGLAGLVAWFAAAAPWYWRAGSALVVLAALALAYQIFAALHVRRLDAGRVGGSRDRSAVTWREGASGPVLKRRDNRRPSSPFLRRQAGAGKAPQKLYSPAGMVNVEELPPAARARILAQIGART